MRYRLYREHKFVSVSLNDLERLVAKTDFRVPAEIEHVRESFESLIDLLQGHAAYEDGKIHPLLAAKGSKVHLHAEEDHREMEEQLESLRTLLDELLADHSSEKRLELGYRFYLAYRKFVADNLLHLHQEETHLLPELQRLYTDEELRAIEDATYAEMNPAQIVHMCQILFPHMDASDRAHFLFDIHKAQPGKFTDAWPELKRLLPALEQAHFAGP